MAPPRDTHHAARSWGLCAAVLLLAWGGLGAMALHDVRSNRAQRAEFARVSVTGFASYANQHLQQVDALLLDVRLRAGVGRLPSEAASDPAPIPMLRHVALADHEGRLIAGTLPPALGVGASIAQRPVFMALRQDPVDRFHLSAPAPGRTPQPLALQAARPLRDAAGNFMGVVVASIDPLTLRNYFGPHKVLPADAVVLLVGRHDGVVRLRFDRSGASWGPSMLVDPGWNELASRGNGAYTSTPDASGGFLAGAFQQVGDFPLAAAVAFREQPWWRVAATRLGIAAAVALALSILLVSITALRVRAQARLQDDAGDDDLRHGDGRDPTALVNSLQELTRAEARRDPVQRARVDLCALLSEVVSTQSEAAGHKGVPMTLAMDLPSGQRVIAQTDSRKLSQAIDNVLHNSVQCTPDGAIWVTARLDGADFIVRVVDTGQGLPSRPAADEAQAQARGPGAGTARDALHGPGLGLALSRELMQVLGGTITLTMEPGEGTQVELRLPQAQLEPLEPASA